MASVEDVFNGNFGKKKDKKKLVSSEPQVKVFYAPPVPINHVAQATVDFVPPDMDEHRPVVSETIDYSQLSKDEQLIILQADNYLKSVKPIQPKPVPNGFQTVAQTIPSAAIEKHNDSSEESYPPKRIVGSRIKWREYGGWWLSILLGVILIGLVITILGR